MRSIGTRALNVAAVVVISGIGLAGRQLPPLPPGAESGVTFELPLEGPMWTQAEPMALGDVTFEVLAPPIGTHGEPITGAPYSAEAVTEMVQTLADGNRITRQSTMQTYRDGSGRMRREGGLAIVGPLVSGDQMPRLISIHDVVAGVTYILDPVARTARKMTPPRFVSNVVTSATSSSGGAAAEEIEIGFAPGAAGARAEWMALHSKRGVPNLPKPVTETLGSRVIEGVEAEGTRSTVTIPAGQIGNEQPIQIVAERWFSSALEVVVESRRSDPRFGETTYRLTGIVRAEPAPSLFEVPPDFKLIEEKGHRFFRGLPPQRGSQP